MPLDALVHFFLAMGGEHIVCGEGGFPVSFSISEQLFYFLLFLCGNSLLLAKGHN